MTAPRIVLATLGTYGDVHPFIAVALRLRERGCEPVVATSSTYRHKIESEGIQFRRLRPEQEDIERDLGLTRMQLLRRAARRPDFVLRSVVLPYLQASYEDSLAALADADLVVTHTTALATKVAAEKLKLPHLGVALQPMAFMSAFDPPVLPPAPELMRWVYGRGPVWKQRVMRLIKYVSRSWAAPIEALRTEVGLPPSAGHPFFAGQFTAEGALALYSRVLGRPQPDHPVDTSIVGFAFYDALQGGIVPRLSPELEEFLDGGEPPVVFTLGTSAVHDAENFIRTSLVATINLGCRAVMVLDQEQRDRWGSHASDRILFCNYEPYSLLFPFAAVIVHHGGVGTTAQALRAGRPQLIAPYLVDQPDNASRVQRLGVGRALALQRYTAPRVTDALQFLLTDVAVEARARNVAIEVASEDGAGAAVNIITALLERQANGVASAD